MQISPGGPKRVQLLSNVTAGTSAPLPILGMSILTFYVEGAGTIDGGAVVFEEAAWLPDEPPYSGTWSDLTAGTPVDATDVTGGAQLGYHVGGPGGVYAYDYVRARISDAITGGGTVSVYAVVA